LQINNSFLLALALCLVGCASAKSQMPKHTVSDAFAGIKSDESIVVGRFSVKQKDPSKRLLLVVPSSYKQKENCTLDILHNGKVPNFGNVKFTKNADDVSPLSSGRFYLPDSTSNTGLYYFKVPAGDVDIRSITCGKVTQKPYAYRSSVTSDAFEIPLGVKFVAPQKGKVIYVGDYFMQVDLKKNIGDSISQALTHSFTGGVSAYKFYPFNSLILASDNMQEAMNELSSGNDSIVANLRQGNVAQANISALDKKEYSYSAE
jgi:hypothetical protein